jgi:ribokinase
VIVVIGSINLDLIAGVDRIPAPGETVPGDSFSTAPGGKGANQALAACRAGVDVRMVGAVGQDAFADDALSILANSGVDLSAVRQTHASTGTALIMVSKDGENVIAVVPGANATLVPGDVATAHLEKNDILLLQHEIPLTVVRRALETARKLGAVSVLNTAPFRAEAAELLAQADYVVANETEFDAYAKLLDLAGTSRDDRMADFAARTGRTIVVTLGARGVQAATPKGTFGARGLVIEPVDTVGAGDTFCGYFAAALSEGAGLEQALRRSAVAGSLACLKPGAQPSIPMHQAVDEALAKAGA